MSAEKRRKKNTATLLKEANPFLTGEPAVRTLPLFEEMSATEKLAQSLKASIPFVQGRIRPDTMAMHALAMDFGVLHVVCVYSDTFLLPVEYLVTLSGRIPRAVYLDRKGWKTAEGDSKDDFARFADGIVRGKGLRRRVLYNGGFELETGMKKVRLSWGFQFIPLGDDRYIFASKRPYRTGILIGSGVSKYHIGDVVDDVKMVEHAVAELDYQGPSPEFEVPIPSLSFIALPELAESNNK